jgi:6-phosphogluconolactonase
MSKDGQNYLAYIGTYTRRESFVDGEGAGIYVYRLDPASGNLDYQSTLTGLINPSFLALSPAQDRLFAVNEVYRGVGSSGMVSSFAIDAGTGDLTYINSESTYGFAPCHLSVDPSGRYVLVANYESGSLAVVPVSGDGRLKPATDIVRWRGSGPHPRQDRPHAHMIIHGPVNGIHYAVDLGTDRIRTYRLNKEQGKLEPATPAVTRLPSGTGPRHLAFHSNGRFAYTINELTSTVTLLRIDGDSDVLIPEQTISNLPDGYKGENPGGEIQIGPAGHFLYATNRGHNSIAIYGIDQMNGRLALVGHQSALGRGPRHFAFDPTGQYLVVANQDTYSLVTFRMDPISGELSATEPAAQVPTPVCICFRAVTAYA